MALVFYFPLIGTPTAEGNLLSFCEAGTNVPLSVWTDSDLSIPWNQPIVLNSAGESDGPIYLSSSPAYKTVYTDANGAAIAGYPVDMVTPANGVVSMFNAVRQSLTNAQILALPTTSVVMSDLAAPAAGMRIKILGTSWAFNTNAAAYTHFDTSYTDLHISLGSDIVVYGPVNDSTTTPALTSVHDLLGVTGQHVYDTLTPSASAVPAVASLEYVQNTNTGTYVQQSAAQLSISMDNNGHGNLTGGDVANSGLVTVYYALEPLV